MTWDIIQADARQLPLDDDSVDLIVTSPPYWGLRSYRDGGEHYDGQIGSEDSPQEFVDELVGMVDSEWRRVLKPVGSLWLNLGDKYAGSGMGPDGKKADGAIDTARTGDRQAHRTDARPKSLLGLPWRVALALIDRGWILRAEVIWSKPNGLPESVTDRVRRSHEQWFHFVLEPQYFSAVDEIREPHMSVTPGRKRSGAAFADTKAADGGDGRRHDDGNPLGRLPGSVWTIPTEPLIIPDGVREHLGLVDHFAAFPTEWPRRIILGWSPSGVCVECGEGRRPVVESALAADMGRAQSRRANEIAEANGLTDAHRRALLSVGLGDTGRSAAVQSGTGKNTAETQRLADEARAVLGSYAREFTLVTPTITGYACACWQPIRVDVPHHYTGMGDCPPDGSGCNDPDHWTTTPEWHWPDNDDPPPTTPAVILDPMCGTGTVPGVAHKLGRHGVGVDLSGDYVRLARWRIEHSGHFEKVTDRTWADRQGTLL